MLWLASLLYIPRAQLFAGSIAGSRDAFRLSTYTLTGALRIARNRHAGARIGISPVRRAGSSKRLDDPREPQNPLKDNKKRERADGSASRLYRSGGSRTESGFVAYMYICNAGRPLRSSHVCTVQQLGISPPPSCMLRLPKLSSCAVL